MTTIPVRDAFAGLVSFERRLFVGLADRIARVPSLSGKMLLCSSVWESADRIGALLRALPADEGARAVECRPDDRSDALLGALDALHDEPAYLFGLCRVVAPFTAGRYRELGARAADERSRRHLARALRQLTCLARWRAAHLPRESPPTARALDGMARALVDHHVTMGPRVYGPTDMRSAPELRDPARERAIRALRYGEACDETWYVSSASDAHRYLHQLIAFEINTFEAVSRHIAEFAAMPWEFHVDMAGQVRDELAHLRMWLERLSSCGGRLGMHPLNAHEFVACIGHELAGRVALLERLIESSALDSLVLNRCMWESRGDSVMVACLDRVQADEIRHVRNGNKWLRRLCGTDAELVALVEQAEAKTRTRMLEAAGQLERAGLAPPGNVERLQRKFDAATYLEVQHEVRRRAGFSDDEITEEVARRRANAGAARGGVR